MRTEIQYWLAEEEIAKIYSSDYWCDEEKEKHKEWYILNGDSNKLVNYLKKETTYFEEYESITKIAANTGLTIEGLGVDLGAGVCWTTSFLSRIESVGKVYAIDISKHRLLKIAPVVFDLFKAKKEKVVRVIGSFYDIKLPDGSVNFCLMSQAFHHANEPDSLLSEVWRILKPSGFALIIGETPITSFRFLKKYVMNIIKMIMPFSIFQSNPVYKLFPGSQDLFPPDPALGDHYYYMKEYTHIFKRNGFRLVKKRKSHFTDFIAIKENQEG